MLVSPKNLKLNKLLKDHTLNFETNKKNYGNLVFIPTDDKEELYAIITSSLMKPQQMQALYTNRIIKPMGRQPIRYDIGELYSEIKNNTNGRIIYCKMNANLYGGRNLIYDMTNEFRETAALVQKVKPGKMGADYMQEYMNNYFKTKINELKYEKNYLILPFVKYIPKFRAHVMNAGSTEYHPIILFLKSLRQEKVEYYLDFDRIIFYNPYAKAMLAIDPSDPSIVTDFQDLLMKVSRLNAYNNNEETFEDLEAETELQPEDYEESVKDQLKEVIFKKVAKEIKAKNLTDFDAATKEEREIILAIDKKMDEYLSKPENLQKPFNELVTTIETDNSVKAKAIKYIETKRLAQNKAINMSQNLTQEVKAIDKVSDLVLDEHEYEPTKFKTKIQLDPRVQESSLSAMDKEYNTKSMKNDINDAFTAFSNNSYLPTAVTDIRYEDSSDDFNEKETAYVKYKTDDNQTLSFAIDIPKIVDGHYIYVNGNKFIIPKQLLRLPIVKTKSDRIEITTSYQKMTIERSGSHVSRKNAYLLKELKTYNNPTVEINYGDNSLINNKYDNDFEYEELAASISSIKTNNLTINFNRDITEEHAYAIGLSEDFFTGTMTPIGYTDDIVYYIEDSKIKSVKVEGDSLSIKEVAESLYDFLINDVLKFRDRQKVSIGKAFIYSNVKFLTVRFPLFVLVGLMNGMTNILERHKVKYFISDKKVDNSKKYVEVKFKDVYFYYEDIIENTMLLNILYAMSPEEYDFSDFDTDGPFMDYLVDKMNQPMYVKQTLMINLDKMIDPISRAVLTDMGLPTDIYDLLLLANNMLINNKYQSLNDMTNYRIRGNEVIAAALYETLAMAHKNYQQYKMNGNARNITIKRNELISKLIAQNNINSLSLLNPIAELEDAYQCSAKGLKGVNLSRAYTLEMRSYDETMQGYLSGNATAYSGSVGIARGLSFNPKLNNIRGYIKDHSKDKTLSAANTLSVTEMLSPFTAAKADAPRAAMNVSQSKHLVPVKVMHKPLFGSGVNKSVGYLISDTFCFKAKKNGTVEEIDNVNKLVILKYEDGSRDSIDISEVMVKNSNSGFFIKQKLLLVYDIGENFKEGEIIAYNPKFFTGKGDDVDLNNGTLAKVAVMCSDGCFEDATMISEKLSEKCSTSVSMLKAIALNPNTIIHHIAKEGDQVEVGETLLEFTAAEDEISAEILQGLYDELGENDYNELTHEKVVSKYSGVISKIEIYYNREFEELNPSLQETINNYKKTIEKRKNKLRSMGVSSSSTKIAPVTKQSSTKVHSTEYDGVLICFWIEYDDPMSVGDKMTFQTALKGVVAKVFSEDESPISEYREEDVIEAIETPTGIISRMTVDFYSILWINKILVEVGKQIKEIWEK